MAFGTQSAISHGWDGRPVPLPVVSESGGGPTSPGWYTDPAGRFEYRYHNGVVWTSDVASNGQRYVDPLAAGVAPPPYTVHVGNQPSDVRGNGIAIAAMVCGIVSVVLGWLPVVFAIAVVLAVLAIIFGIVGMRRSRATGRRRGFAIAGVVTGALGIPIAVIGLIFTIAVFTRDRSLREPARVDVVDRIVRGRGGAGTSRGRTAQRRDPLQSIHDPRQVPITAVGDHDRAPGDGAVDGTGPDLGVRREPVPVGRVRRV